MISVKNLCKSYDKPVLEDVNLEIEDGSIFGLIGINGAGKTTILNMLSGVMKQDSGEILYDDLEVYENNLVKKNIFYLPDEPYYTMNTTPKSLLKTYKMFYEVDEDIYFEYLNSFKLPIDDSMYNFSKGMKRQVFVSLAFAIKPKYLFLDETFDGLDPFARLILKRGLIALADDNDTTVIISSHSLRELSDICDSYGIINKTKVLSYGDVDSLLNKYHKYTVGFENEISPLEFDIPLLKYNIDGRVTTFVTEWNYDSVEEKLMKYNPVIFEENPLDFEEEFMVEVKTMGVVR